MAITTFLHQDALRPTQDPHIGAQLAALRQPPVIEEEAVVIRRRWWQRPRRLTAYRVLWPLDDTMFGLEWQVVNFYRDTSGTSINTVVPKEMVLAYLYGCRTAQASEAPCDGSTM